MNKEKLLKMINEEVTRILAKEIHYDDFSDLEGEEETSWEPDDVGGAIQVGVDAILESLYQYDPSQDALDALESQLKEALSTIRGGVIEDIVSGKARL